MTLVEIYNIAGDNSTHTGGQRQILFLTKDMEMIRHQNPGIDFHRSILGQCRQTIYKIIAIRIALKYFSSLNDPTHYMVQHSGRI